MTTGTTPPAYSTTYGRLATAALTQGWSVSHRDLAPGLSWLTAQRGNTTLAFVFAIAPNHDGDDTYYITSLTETRLLWEDQAYVDRSRRLTLDEALMELAA